MLFKHVGKNMLSPEAMQPFHQYFGCVTKRSAIIYSAGESSGTFKT